MTDTKMRIHRRAGVLCAAAILLGVTVSAGDIATAGSGTARTLAAMTTYAASRAVKDELASRGARAYADQDREMWIGGVQYDGTVCTRDGVTFVELGEFAGFCGGGEFVCTAGTNGRGEYVSAEDFARPQSDCADDCEDGETGDDYANGDCAAEVFSSWDEQACAEGFSVTDAEVRGGRYAVHACAGKEYIESNGRYFWGEAENVSDGNRMFVPVRAVVRAFGLDFHEDGAVYVTGGGDVADGSDFYREDEVYWLSRIIEAESGCEMLRGKIAVGSVVLNRVADPQFPDTIYSVIWDHRFGVQFSPTANGAIFGEPSEESVIAAKICLEGDTVSETVMYFVNPVIAESSWVQDNRPYEMTIGHHAFFG